MAYFTYSNWTSPSSVMIGFDIDMARHIVDHCMCYKNTLLMHGIVIGGPTLIRFFFFFRRARLQRPPKADSYPPASETPLKWRFAGGPIAQR